MGSPLPLTPTDRPDSFSVAQSLFKTHSRLLLQNKAAIVTCVTPHTARAINTYKQKEIEGNYIPHMSGLLTKIWKCKQMV